MADAAKRTVAVNEQAWFGWVFGLGRTVILPSYPATGNPGMVTIEKQFGVLPFVEEDRK